MEKNFDLFLQNWITCVKIESEMQNDKIPIPDKNVGYYVVEKVTIYRKGGSPVAPNLSPTISLLPWAWPTG